MSRTELKKLTSAGVSPIYKLGVEEIRPFQKSRQSSSPEHSPNFWKFLDFSLPIEATPLKLWRSKIMFCRQKCRQSRQGRQVGRQVKSLRAHPKSP